MFISIQIRSRIQNLIRIQVIKNLKYKFHTFWGDKSLKIQKKKKQKKNYLKYYQRILIIFISFQFSNYESVHSVGFFNSWIRFRDQEAFLYADPCGSRSGSETLHEVELPQHLCQSYGQRWSRRKIFIYTICYNCFQLKKEVIIFSVVVFLNTLEKCVHLLEF